MKTLIAPNGAKLIIKDSDERKTQRMIDRAQEKYDVKIAKREEKKKEYYLRVRARYEAWEAKQAAKKAEAEITEPVVEGTNDVVEEVPDDTLEEAV